MTWDKSNHSVLITVSLTLLISIAVPTSACSCASAANSWASPLALKPPSLLLSPPLCWSPSHLLSSSCHSFSCLVWSQLFSPCGPRPPSTSPACPAVRHLLSPPCPPARCTALPSEEPWLPFSPKTSFWHRHHPAIYTRPWYLSTPHCKTKPTSSMSPSFPPALPFPGHAVILHHLRQQRQNSWKSFLTAFGYGWWGKRYAAPHEGWGVRRGQPSARPPQPICLRASKDTCSKHVWWFQDICFGSGLR